jgi:hypothetical protein
VKTPGQRLYEHLSPPTIAMVPYHNRQFATSRDIVLVPNDKHVPWEFLYEHRRQSYEEQAKTHWFTTSPATR